MQREIIEGTAYKMADVFLRFGTKLVPKLCNLGNKVEHLIVALYRY